MEIHESAEQFPNADASMCEVRSADSNVRLDNLAQSEKQFAPTLSTEDGMQNEESDEQGTKTSSSRSDRLDPDSNVTVESVPHPKKHFAPTVSSEQGIQIDESVDKFYPGLPNKNWQQYPLSNKLREISRGVCQY
jgi:hypothetical protein